MELASDYILLFHRHAMASGSQPGSCNSAVMRA
jgi:hypothetical protein